MADDHEHENGDDKVDGDDVMMMIFASAMNVSNLISAFYGPPLYPDDEEYDDWDEEDDGHHGDKMVGVVPVKVYLSIIYFILIFGSIGNACIVAMMQHCDFQKLSYPVYLIALAVSDTLLLAVVATEDILDHQFGRLEDFFLSSLALCRFWNYFVSILRVNSPWLVVGMTLDRFVAVVFPLKRSAFCSRRTALIFCSILLAALSFESLFYALLSEHADDNCLPPDWKHLRNYVIFRTLVSETSLPCAFILFLNVYIVITINRSRRFRAASAASRQAAKTSRVDKATVSLMAVSIMAFVALVPISILQYLFYAVKNTPFIGRLSVMGIAVIGGFEDVQCTWAKHLVTKNRAHGLRYAVCHEG
ncbi:hypothetical protein EGW08_019082 [Elysia chlorotica]|uniref:G-protein coupled receptors family 1 profile domain-containing protein n=1 Tax=Elysia chlorotica TaxID=188477 RepID=A0A433SV46_ELYCH|nr:hypothetical protein EGW08_019082 [Elysia chlorotica]